MEAGKTSGSSKKTLQAWTNVVAHRYGVKSSATLAGAEMSVASAEWSSLGLADPILIAHEPQSNEQWQNRLRIAEQMSATALRARPYVYCIDLDPKNQRRRTGRVEVLRCAFGLVVVSGPMRLWRMTAYYVHPWALSHVIEGSDGFFPLKASATNGEFDLAKLEKGLEKLCAGISLVQQQFAKRPEVRAILDAQAERLSAEVVALDSLYFDPLYQRGLLHGVPLEGFAGDPAIEAEYRRRLDSIVKRYTLAVQLRILSLGFIRCEGKKRQTKTGIEVSLPFIDFKLSTL
jgi:hypothetical protein